MKKKPCGKQGWHDHEVDGDVQNVIGEGKTSSPAFDLKHLILLVSSTSHQSTSTMNQIPSTWIENFVTFPTNLTTF